MASQISSASALAFASVEDIATLCCFLDAYEIGLHANLNIQPVTDFLLILQFAQSESVKPKMVELWGHL